MRVYLSPETKGSLENTIRSCKITFLKKLADNVKLLETSGFPGFVFNKFLIKL